MKSIASDVITALGILAMSGGLYLLAPWIGISVLGLLLIGYGFLLDPPRPTS